MTLIVHVYTITDPRRREGGRFDPPHLLLFTLLAIVSGANSYGSPNTLHGLPAWTGAAGHRRALAPHGCRRQGSN